MKETTSYTHYQILTPRMRGIHTNYIECVDVAGNKAEKFSTFILKVDSVGPSVVRVYKDDGKLKIITDELAECYYDPQRCNFDFDNATLMTIGFSKTHNAELIEGQTYYIKCMDEWGNANTDCAMIARAERDVS